MASAVHSEGGRSSCTTLTCVHTTRNDLCQPPDVVDGEPECLCWIVCRQPEVDAPGQRHRTNPNPGGANSPGDQIMNPRPIGLRQRFASPASTDDLAARSLDDCGNAALIASGKAPEGIDSAALYPRRQALSDRTLLGHAPAGPAIPDCRRPARRVPAYGTRARDGRVDEVADVIAGHAGSGQKRTPPATTGFGDRPGMAFNCLYLSAVPGLFLCGLQSADNPFGIVVGRYADGLRNYPLENLIAGRGPFRGLSFRNPLSGG